MMWFIKLLPNSMQNMLTTFTGGCFWCTEAVFKQLKGEEKVISGYSGGKTKDPNYHEVSAGNTGHAESIQITFNPNIISCDQLLEVFFSLIIQPPQTGKEMISAPSTGR